MIAKEDSQAVGFLHGRFLHCRGFEGKHKLQISCTLGCGNEFIVESIQKMNEGGSPLWTTVTEILPLSKSICVLGEGDKHSPKIGFRTSKHFLMHMNFSRKQPQRFVKM